ncbi:MAG: 4-Hydroxy-2-oxoglutarate aldolase @ 2-dehydro-3-deoxyphosphogluconate aldolase, partial [uncultured Acetobacteraceae bacterium]
DTRIDRRVPPRPRGARGPDRLGGARQDSRRVAARGGLPHLRDHHDGAGLAGANARTRGRSRVVGGRRDGAGRGGRAGVPRRRGAFPGDALGGPGRNRHDARSGRAAAAGHDDADGDPRGGRGRRGGGEDLPRRVRRRAGPREGAARGVPPPALLPHGRRGRFERAGLPGSGRGFRRHGRQAGGREAHRGGRQGCDPARGARRARPDAGL